MVWKTDMVKLTVLLGVTLLLSMDVALCYTPGVGIQDATGEDIWVKCQSKDTQFDPRTMQNNEVWSWYFHPNFYGTTLFWCDFAWRNFKADFIVWNIDVAPVYDYSINDWSVRQDGFALYDPVKNVWNYKHFWSPASSADDSGNVEKERELTAGAQTNGF